LLGGCELLISQHTGIVQLGQLLELGSEIVPGWCGRGWGCISLLLSLGICSALLVGIIICILGIRSLLGILLILMMVDRTGRAGDDCRAYRDTRHTSSSHYSSGSHINLLIFFLD
jgi:hypothetical protein